MTTPFAIVRRWMWVMAAVAITTGSMVAAASSAATPSATIENFHHALLGVMKDAEKLGFKGRYDRLAPAIDTVFDLERTLRVATNPAWTKATPAEQKALLAAFRRITLGTYASRFDGFSGQSFAINSEKSGPQQTTLVSAHIVRPGKTPVALTYVMTEKDSAWRIIDVILDTGISELATRRSEYSRILTVDGVDGLVKALNAKADQLVTP